MSFYKMLGFYPYNITLYEQALLHKSSSIKLKNGKWINNERLEFLGDAILDAIVADVVFKEFEYKKEGFLTNMRSRIVQRETLNKLALDIGIDKLIKTSAKNTAHNTHMYGNALEALIGAIYLDQGYRIAKRFVYERLIHQYLNIEKVAQSEGNFKSRLIEWSQKYKIPIEFVLLDSYVDNKNNPYFKTAVYILGIEVGFGEGFSKKESQQKASREAMKRINSDTVFRNHIFSLFEEQQSMENQYETESSQPESEEEK